MESRLSAGGAVTSPEDSYSGKAMEGIPAEGEGKIYQAQKSCAAIVQREELHKWMTPFPSEIKKDRSRTKVQKWLAGGVRMNNIWIPIKTGPNQTSMLEDYMKVSAVDHARQLPGWCYMALIKQEYHKGYHWPAYPMAAQLAQLPKEMRNNCGAEITQEYPSTYHVYPDERPQHCTPWKAIENMGCRALKWVSIGAEGSVDWFLAQITAMQAQITTLTASNAELQTQVAAIEPGHGTFDVEALAEALAAVLPRPPPPRPERARPSA
ncbi:hypothetical protein F5887DRAFT_1071677 [Amanita rubescens]|nr:hypothetical protein F5887DRAFT_1071677 [Amanita rubescens]